MFIHFQGAFLFRFKMLFVIQGSKKNAVSRLIYIGKSYAFQHILGVLTSHFEAQKQSTLQGTNISHLGKRKIIFKMPFWGDMLVPWRVNLNLHLPPWNCGRFTSHPNLKDAKCFSNQWHLFATNGQIERPKVRGHGENRFLFDSVSLGFLKHPTVSPSISPSLPEVLTLLVVLNLPIFQVHHQRRVSPSSVPKLDHV